MTPIKIRQPYHQEFPEAHEQFKLTSKVIRPARIVAAHRAHAAAALTSGGVARIEAGGRLIVDLGDEHVGRLELSLSSDSPGSCQAIYGESIEECQTDNAFDIGWYRRPSDTWTAGATAATVLSADRRACRYVLLAASGKDSVLSVSDLKFRSEHYPAQERGSFSCSDVRLNRIWDICSRTTLLCMQQYYEDGPKRDGLLWLGDARIQMLCNYYAFGDAELARKSLFIFASTQTSDGWIPANSMSGDGHHHPMDYMPSFPEEALGSWRLLHYCADYAPMVLEYFMFTGDRETIVRLWPSVVRQLDHLVATITPSKLEVRLQKDLMTDTDFVRERRWASEGVFLLQLLESLRSGEQIAGLLASDAHLGSNSIARWRACAEECEHAIRTQYWSQRLGLFVDYPTREPEFEQPSWHVNAHAAVRGVLPDGHSATDLLAHTAAFAAQRWIPRPVDGPPEYVLVDALFRSGLARHAFSEIEAYWGGMLDWGASTCWEAFDPDTVSSHPGAERPLSLCHGWSAAANILLPARVAGLVPTAPGLSHCQLTPTLGDLEWVDACIPTPAGSISVSLEMHGSQIRGQVTIPAGTTVNSTDSEGTAVELTTGTHDINMPGSNPEWEHKT